MSFSVNPRSESVLKALIEAYLLDGEPVGSRLLSRRLSQPLSPATIRNVLVDLEDEALLSQPHTSAGRVPTEKSYRYYVNRWVLPTRPDPDVGQRLESALDTAGKDPDIWLRHATKVLSEVMNGICLALPLHLTASRLVRLEFVPLGTHRIVAIWVGSGGEVEHQVMDNPWGFDSAMLVELGNFATRHFTGCTLPQLRSRLFTALQDRANQVRELCRRLSELAEHLKVSETAPDNPLLVAGLGNLGRLPDFEDPQQFRSLVETFEEHERLVRLLNAFAESASSDVQLLLGSENPFMPSMPLATALRTVMVGPGERVAFAVVQPLRVNYVRFLGGLAWWSEALARKHLRAVQ
jgi:heat-inducible transcriptional repressor